MRPLRYSINVTLDGCCDHRVMIPDEDLHRHAAENLAQADALLFGRVTYEMMEAGWRQPVPAGARPDWMEDFARTSSAFQSTWSNVLDTTYFFAASIGTRSSCAGTILGTPFSSSSESRQRDCSLEA